MSDFQDVFSVPSDIRAARIGSCMNDFTQELMPYNIAFNIGMLNSENLLIT